MSTEFAQNDIQATYEFLGRRMIGGEAALSPEQSVREFRLYQDELARFIRESESAEQESRRGEARPLDVDGLMQRVTERLARENRAD